MGRSSWMGTAMVPLRKRSGTLLPLWMAESPSSTLADALLARMLLLMLLSLPTAGSPSRMAGALLMTMLMPPPSLLRATYDRWA